ncbi:hypothetical protein [Vogesella indigofera]|nr:hypothetical protein [Vogesella indigofera]MDC7697604.1 hypothetical protein [Vogesella indigofera]
MDNKLKSGLALAAIAVTGWLSATSRIKQSTWFCSDKIWCRGI